MESEGLHNIRYGREEKGCTTFDMESEEYPDQWAIIERRAWGEFKTWAKNNFNRIQSRCATFSFLGHVVRRVSVACNNGADNPIVTCLESGANPDEVMDGERVLVTLAERHREESKRDPNSTGFLRSIGALIEKGAKQDVPDQCRDVILEARRFVARNALKNNCEVTVQHGFLSGENQLSKGMKGSVHEVFSNGDAHVHFPALEKRNDITRKGGVIRIRDQDFDKLEIR